MPHHDYEDPSNTHGGAHDQHGPPYSSAQFHKSGQPNDASASTDRSWGSSIKMPSEGSATTPTEPIFTWPPRGMTVQSRLTRKEAMSLIAKGAVCFEVVVQDANHNMDHWTHLRFHPALKMTNGMKILEASAPAVTVDCMSASLKGDVDECDPQDTLEQPSMARCFGTFPGTVTLARYMANLNQPPITINAPSNLMLRMTDLSSILDRLIVLQNAGEAPFEATELQGDFLHNRLIFDPTANSNQVSLIHDINELTTFLNDPIWINFGDSTKQLVISYIKDQDILESVVLFFQQILLSVELDRRIHAFESRSAPSYSNDFMFSILPYKVAWSVLTSRILLKNMNLEKRDVVPKGSSSSYSVDPLNKLSHIAKVLDIGYALDWPCMNQVEARMQIESEHPKVPGCWTPPSETFLYGLSLPGPSASWNALSCLLDCSPEYRSTLAGLDEMCLQSGFQFLEHTYWYFESIIGKVMGAVQGSKSVAGWIGPCMYSQDLAPVQYVRVYQAPSEVRMKNRDRIAMPVRSHPLGVPRDEYRVGDYHLPLPDFEKKVEDVSVEQLALRIHLDPASELVEPNVYDAAVRFTVRDRSSLVHLQYNVSFVAAAACWTGPHVLCKQYAYKAVGTDSLLCNSEWAGGDDDTVLLVEAYGSADCAVLARAWCSYMGFSAVVANIRTTCLACTVREAYAARMAIAIVSDLPTVEESPSRAPTPYPR